MANLRFSDQILQILDGGFYPYNENSLHVEKFGKILTLCLVRVYENYLRRNEVSLPERNLEMPTMFAQLILAVAIKKVFLYDLKDITDSDVIKIQAEFDYKNKSVAKGIIRKAINLVKANPEIIKWAEKWLTEEKICEAIKYDLSESPDDDILENFKILLLYKDFLNHEEIADFDVVPICISENYEFEHPFTAKIVIKFSSTLNIQEIDYYYCRLFKDVTPYLSGFPKHREFQEINSYAVLLDSQNSIFYQNLTSPEVFFLVNVLNFLKLENQKKDLDDLIRTYSYLSSHEIGLEEVREDNLVTKYKFHLKDVQFYLESSPLGLFYLISKERYENENEKLKNNLNQLWLYRNFYEILLNNVKLNEEDNSFKLSFVSFIASLGQFEHIEFWKNVESRCSSYISMLRLIPLFKLPTVNILRKYAELVEKESYSEMLKMEEKMLEDYIGFTGNSNVTTHKIRILLKSFFQTKTYKEFNTETKHDGRYFVFDKLIYSLLELSRNHPKLQNYSVRFLNDNLNLTLDGKENFVMTSLVNKRVIYRVAQEKDKFLYFFQFDPTDETVYLSEKYVYKKFDDSNFRPINHVELALEAYQDQFFIVEGYVNEGGDIRPIPWELPSFIYEFVIKANSFLESFFDDEKLLQELLRISADAISLAEVESTFSKNKFSKWGAKVVASWGELLVFFENEELESFCCVKLNYKTKQVALVEPTIARPFLEEADQHSLSLVLETDDSLTRYFSTKRGRKEVRVD